MTCVEFSSALLVHLQTEACVLGADEEVQLVKRNGCIVLLVLVSMMLAGGYAIAHHSFAAEFDAEKPITLKGIVVKWEMVNPHGWITIDVKGADGKTAQWMIE